MAMDYTNGKMEIITRAIFIATKDKGQDLFIGSMEDIIVDKLYNFYDIYDHFLFRYQKNKKTPTSWN